MLGASASASAAPSPSCQNIFLEPLAWMRGVEDASVVEKKLCCPKCETKVGHFNWSGSVLLRRVGHAVVLRAVREGGRHAVRYLAS